MSHLTIDRVWRGTEDSVEELVLFKGVNLLVGEPNTGKTSWLRIIDYLMGSTKQPDHVMSPHVSNAYDSVGMTISIGDRRFELERNWRSPGGLTNVLVDGERLQADLFSDFMLDLLQIPLVHYPKGNPYAGYTWPALGWRSLYRHVYRREGSWSSVAAQQPDSEQLACMLQFLGVAEEIYSPEYGELVSARKERDRLEARKEQFSELLSTVTREIAATADPSLVGSTESVTAVLRGLDSRRRDLQDQRLASQLPSASQGDDALEEVAQLAHDRAQAVVRAVQLSEHLSTTRARARQIDEYQNQLLATLRRLKRARVAGNVLTGFRITHCPACDQPVRQTDAAVAAGACFLCDRPLVSHQGDSEDPTTRLEFEIAQIKDEQNENRKLLADLRLREGELVSELTGQRKEVADFDARLEKYRTVSVAVDDEAVRRIDEEIGRLSEQMRQVASVNRLLAEREELEAQIASVSQRVEELATSVNSKVVSVDFDELGSLLTTGMSQYITKLNADAPRWNLADPLAFSIRRDGFRISVGSSSWQSRLGGALSIYLLLAYHYGLLSLTGESGSRYPGLSILDFPPSLADVADVDRPDYESHAIAPFTDLAVTRPDIQVIAAGRAFGDLPGVNRIEFAHVY